MQDFTNSRQRELRISLPEVVFEIRACRRVLPTMAHLVRRDDRFSFSVNSNLAEFGSGHRMLPLLEHV